MIMTVARVLTRLTCSSGRESVISGDLYANCALMDFESGDQ